jgi:hypothetical protein
LPSTIRASARRQALGEPRDAQLDVSIRPTSRSAGSASHLASASSGGGDGGSQLVRQCSAVSGRGEPVAIAIAVAYSVRTSRSERSSLRSISSRSSASLMRESITRTSAHAGSRTMRST